MEIFVIESCVFMEDNSKTTATIPYYLVQLLMLDILGL